ncbi:MAG: alpha/beta hydrolase [bacterium]|nr:alpha/beta hydrolase [bacterium]
MKRLITFITGLLVMGLIPAFVPADVSGKPAEAKMHTVMVDGHALALWEKGHSNTKDRFLLLHGRTWSSLPDFDLQVPGEELSMMDRLVKQGYRVYALDMRGYGKSKRDATGWLTPDRAAEDVAAVLEWISQRTRFPGKPVLFGWSMGSMVAQLCVQRYPGRVSAVVLFGYPIDPDFKAPQDNKEKPARQKNTAKNAASDFITPGSISQKAIDIYVKVSLAADPVRVDWNLLHEFNELDPAKVKVPTLLIHGEHDPYAPSKNQAKFFAKLGTAHRQWVTIPGGDHAAFMEKPKRMFYHSLYSFLQWLKTR